MHQNFRLSIWLKVDQNILLIIRIKTTDQLVHLLKLVFKPSSACSSLTVLATKTLAIRPIMAAKQTGQTGSTTLIRFQTFGRKTETEMEISKSSIVNMFQMFPISFQSWQRRISNRRSNFLISVRC